MTSATPETRYPHLPPGREPGPQSRRSRQGSRIAVVLVGIIGVGFLVGAVFAVAAGVAVLAAFFVAMAAGMGALTWWLHRRANPSGLPNLELTTDGDEKRRGDSVTVTVRIGSPDGLDVERLELGLICTESFDYEQVTRSRNGTQRSRQTRQVTAHEDWREVDRRAPEQAISFEIPGQAPFSFEGDCVSYAWRVSAREPRSRRMDRRVDRPIWVLP
jgi:hypothetical protein